MCCNSLEALDKFEDGSEECIKDDSEEWKVCMYLRVVKSVIMCV